MSGQLNPYVAGGPVGGRASFIGRQDLIGDLIGSATQGAAPVAITTGLPGSGRTSLLDELAAVLDEQGGLWPMRFDLREFVREPLDVAITAFAQGLGSALELTMPELRGWAEAEFAERYLPNVLGSLENGERIVILMDEFPLVWDPMSRQAAGAFLPWLAGVLESWPGRFSVVFTADLRRPGQEQVLRRYFPEATRHLLGPLDVAAAWALVRQSHVGGSLRWGTEAVERVIQLTAAWPYLCQLLCSTVWTRSRGAAATPAGAPTVTLQDVDDAVVTALDQGHGWMEALWTGLPPGARVVLSCLAVQKEHVLPREALPERLHRSGVRVVTRELETDAPQELLRQGLVVQQGETLAVAAPLLRAWLRRAHPISAELDQLDHAVPEAERLVHEATQLWRQAPHDGARRQAQALLDQALEANPNHSGAMELLATVHERRGDRPAAVRALEMLHVGQPARARPRLVNLLVAEARDATTTSQRAVAFRRVLEIAPGNVEATRELERISHENALVESITGEFRTGGLPAAQPAPAPSPRRAMLQAVLDRDRGAAAETGPTAPVRPTRPSQPGEVRILDEASSGPLLPVEPGAWSTDLHLQTALEATYQGALHALEQGDLDTARTHLAKVISQRPAYRDAARLLYRVVDGTDPEELKRRAERRVSRPLFGGAVALSVAMAAMWLVGVRSPLVAPEVQRSALSAAPAPTPTPEPAPAPEPEPDPEEVARELGEQPAQKETPPAEAAPKGPTAASLTARGWDLLDRGKIGDAELAFDRAVRMGGGADAYYGRGYVAEQLGRNSLAQRDYCQALRRSSRASDTTREVEARLRAIDASCP